MLRDPGHRHRLHLRGYLRVEAVAPAALLFRMAHSAAATTTTAKEAPLPRPPTFWLRASTFSPLSAPPSATGTLHPPRPEPCRVHELCDSACLFRGGRGEPGLWLGQHIRWLVGRPGPGLETTLMRQGCQTFLGPGVCPSQRSRLSWTAAFASSRPTHLPCPLASPAVTQAEPP